MKTYKKTLALFLAFALVAGLFGAFPQSDAPASAAPRSGAWDGSVDISWYDPEKTEFNIETPEQLAGLAALVNGMTDPNCPKVIGDESHLVSIAFPDTMLVGAGGGNITDTVYGSKIDFAYKTIYITADLDMGGEYIGGTWSGPNWTPIGGKYPMKPEVTNGDAFVLDTRFNGVLDGQGHTVSNIYCDRFAAKGFPHSQAVGLVGFLGGIADNSGARLMEFKDGWQPAVKNIVIGVGSIYARRMVGGVVGRVGETSNGVIIENCANFADIRNTDSKGIGGIVGAGWGTGVVRNCYNAGSVTTTYACPAGGIVGSNSGLSIFNSYSVGTIDSNNQRRGRGIGGHDTGTYIVDNCFFLEGSDDDPDSRGYFTGGSRRITINVTALSSTEMKAAEFIDRLNASGSVFVADTANINDGYPILFYQAPGFRAPGSFEVNVEQPAEGGTLSADQYGSVSFGQTVTLSAQADAGWRLRHFTLNGRALNANSITVSADSTVSAVFARVTLVTVTMPHSDDSFLSFTKTGYELSGGEMVYVENKPINHGDTLLEENVISVSAIPYADAAPSDLNLEFIGSFAVSATNAERNPEGTFTVTGAGDAAFSVTQNTAKKSWITLADTSWFTGEGSTYIITTARQLAGVAKLVNIEGLSFEGITILLGNDISLANDDGTIGERIWAAIGRNMSMSFSGTFDGQGYTIYDMTAYSAGTYAGLFGYCSGAVIRNITVRGTVTGEASTAYAAGIVAYASDSVIENCVNRAEITAHGTGAAGIAAYISDGTIVSGCFNRARVSGTSGVGGIVGIVYSGEDIVRDCHNYGEIAAEGDGGFGAGGIVGQLAGLMDGCGNFATVTSADRFTGGLAGYASTRIHSTIANSISTGAVSSNSPNQLAAVGSAVGYAQHLTVENVSAAGTVSTGAAFRSDHEGDLIGREGTVTRSGQDNAARLPSSAADNDRWTHPPDKRAPWSISFTADGAVVETTTYSSASERIIAPPVPEKSGFTAQWANYTLGSRDLIVHAVYRPVIVRGGDSISESGTYFIDPAASGEIIISSGLDVTLNGMLGQGEGLSVKTEPGVDLTLENMRLGGTQTLLSINGGTLSLRGDNALTNTSDARGNENPAVYVSGNVVIDGTGRLFASAGVGNSVIKLEQGAELELRSGELSVFKDGLLGEEGGALFANDASVTISGGIFRGYSDSDNVSVISAQKLNITGGIVRVQAAKSPIAIEGDTVTISGGTIYSFGHTGNSHSHTGAYHSLEAISGLSGTAECEFEQILPFEDIFVTSPYFESVRDARDAGYFAGISATEFAPDLGMTRAMFVTVLHRMSGGRNIDSKSSEFTDVPSDVWYSEAVAWAVANRITEGTSETEFSPDDSVTIEQLALFLNRYIRMTGQAASPSNGDYGAGSSPWARAASAWAVENGILPPDSVFRTEADRALMAAAVIALGALDRSLDVQIL